MNYPTPHINATPDDFGQTVLMPGDPLRSKYIAEHFLENARLVNNVRGVQGYTGTYHGVKVSVMASGMGIPSIGIYSYELYNAFGVQNIMRIGSAGSINPDIHVRDIVIAQGACTDSNFLHQYHIDGTFAPIASYEMLRRAVASCEQVGATYHVGNVLSTDNFYNDDEGMPEVLQTVPAWIKMGVMACEMEAAGLYMTAARWKKNALCICTISDHMLTGEALPAEERQALDVAEAAVHHRGDVQLAGRGTALERVHAEITEPCGIGHFTRAAGIQNDQKNALHFGICSFLS